MEKLTPEFMYQIWAAGLMGYKEFRSWLALESEAFASVRDPEIDAQLDEIARERAIRRRDPISGGIEDPSSGAAAGS